jgi:hypothetical protein
MTASDPSSPESTDERVLTSGGPLDGAVGSIPPPCSAAGFFVYCNSERRIPWWGYFDTDDSYNGVRVFRCVDAEDIIWRWRPTPDQQRLLGSNDLLVREFRSTSSR